MAAWRLASNAKVMPKGLFGLKVVDVGDHDDLHFQA